MSRLEELINQFLEKREIINQCEFFPAIFAFKITGRKLEGLFYINVENKEFSELEIEPRSYPIFKIPFSHFRELVQNGEPKHWIEAFEQGYIKSA